MSINYSPELVTDGAVFVGDARASSTATAGSRLYDQAGVDSTAVKLLIHGNEGSGQSFTDSSLSNHTVTAVGDATHSTTQSRFSGGSIFLDGTGDYLSVTDSSDWAFGTGDFTMDMWVYSTNLNNVVYPGLLANMKMLIIFLDYISITTGPTCISGGKAAGYRSVHFKRRTCGMLINGIILQ